MFVTVERRDAAGRGVSLETLGAAACFVSMVGLIALAGAGTAAPPVTALVWGWPVCAIAGGVLLDMRPGNRTARALVALGAMPFLILGWATLRSGGRPHTTEVAGSAWEIAAPLGCAVCLGIALAARPLTRSVGRLAGAGALGAALVAVIATGRHWVAAREAAWMAVGVGVVACWAFVLREARRDGRTERRRTARLLIAITLAAAVVTTAWYTTSEQTAGYLTSGAVAALAIAVARLVVRSAFRSMWDVGLDVVSALGATGVVVFVAASVRFGAQQAGLGEANVSAAVAAVVTAAAIVPAALGLRSSSLTRRYGNGVITPSDVATITADLHPNAEPRELLGKAARMVATASGARDAQIVLGTDAPELPGRWVQLPLEVGGDRVGVLAVEPSDPEGLEQCQHTVVSQLLPTVALAARAVGLAVEAQHARRDVTRERDAERTRILGDLHDGLGPVLAGMSMRVKAATRITTDPRAAAVLSELAADLAASRTELRRLVSGLAPPALADGLPEALRRLVSSLQTDLAVSPTVALSVDMVQDLPEPVEVAVYRAVAEGITNALRHADAAAICVRVSARDGVAEAVVTDDGKGGPVMPGFGLSSLAQRAASLGGDLTVGPVEPRGTQLRFRLPLEVRSQ